MFSDYTSIGILAANNVIETVQSRAVLPGSICTSSWMIIISDMRILTD